MTRTDHDRGAAGMRYVYPVVSRRAGGVSIGINLNPNNACNWACVYCQVPDLVRGTAPAIDLALLESELDALLDEVVHGSFMTARVPEDARRLNDIAISGNGEPTTSRAFEQVVAIAERAMKRAGMAGTIKLVLITNGSGMGRADVRRGVAAMASLGGEVWFKLDRTTRAGTELVNGVAESPATLARRLETAAALCPTWLQTCVFAIDGYPPADAECDAWIEFVGERLAKGAPLNGVLLYGLARPSMQPAADRLSRLPDAWLHAFARRIEALGLPVRVTP